jgi:hypothetical protein
MLYSDTQTGIPDFPICGQSDGTPIPDSRPNRETGDFPIPDSGRIGNRGFPPRFPAKSGIGGTGIGDFRVWGRPIGQHARLQLLRQPKAGSGRALSGAQVLERCSACRPATNLATEPLGGNMPSVRPTVTSPSLASPSEPPSAVRLRSGMCSRCSYWMGGRGPQAGRQNPSPMLQTADADHTHNGDHVQQVIESTHSLWAPIQSVTQFA